jgi:hypothetical protein
MPESRRQPILVPASLTSRLGVSDRARLRLVGLNPRLCLAAHPLLQRALGIAAGIGSATRSAKTLKSNPVKRVRNSAISGVNTFAAFMSPTSATAQS